MFRRKEAFNKTWYEFFSKHDELSISIFVNYLNFTNKHSTIDAKEAYEDMQLA